jgi:hypothetical protein
MLLSAGDGLDVLCAEEVPGARSKRRSGLPSRHRLCTQGSETRSHPSFSSVSDRRMAPIGTSTSPQFGHEHLATSTMREGVL